MSATHHLKLPLDEQTVRRLKLGDMVYLSGEIVLCAGLPTHMRLLQHIESGAELPMDLKNAVMLHFGGYNREQAGDYEVLYMNPTTSTRFNPYMPRIIRSLALKTVGGKGGLDAECTKAMKDAGCVYLSFPGGVCTLYTNAIREVVSVAWQDFILHYRLVKLRVEELGPGTVGIDAQGNSLYEGLQEAAEDRLPKILEGLNAARAAAAKS
jgi:fumarate hydratase subunit beta